MSEPTNLGELVHDPANRREHTARNIEMIASGLQHVGAARSIVIDEDNVILAGNGVADAAAQAGITEVRVVEASGHELIAVRRRGLTEEQKRALALYDNRAGELSNWNVSQLRADQLDGLPLSAWFTDAELDHVLKTETAAGAATMERALQVMPSREYVVVLCAAGPDGDREFAELRDRLRLGLVRRGGYRAGSPHDAVGIARVVPASTLLAALDACRHSK